MKRIIDFLQEPEDIPIQIGGWYKINIGPECGDKPEYKRFKAIKKYKHFVLFEDKYGTRECFSYWQLARFAS